MLNDFKNKADAAALVQEYQNGPQPFLERSEQFYRQQAAYVADLFCKGFPENKVILLAGPTSSGKTTTSLNLQKELHKRGISTLQVSLDDFFKDNEEAPLLEDGTPDFETAEMLDIAFMEECFAELFAKGSCDFPIFDFVHGKRSENRRPCILDDHTAVIIEGLHALNPVIKERSFCKNALKVYISIKTEFFDGNERLLSTRELRLIRRIIRDANYRGCLPPQTMAMWKNVVRGEDQYIRPFRLEADFWLDSVHLYEPFLYRQPFWELTRDAVWQSEEHKLLAEKLNKSLQKFPVMPMNLVPKDSLLREFLVLP